MTRGKWRSYKEVNVSEKLLRASCGSLVEVTSCQPKAESELLKYSKFASEKSLFAVVFGVTWCLGQERKCKTGKWSDNCEIKIIDSYVSEIELVITWSIRVADELVHLVGFDTSWIIPCENNISTKFEELAHEPYFRQSILVSPKI